MEFPTALLGVALGVGADPAAGRGAGPQRRRQLFGPARLGPAPDAGAGAAVHGRRCSSFPQALVATLFQHGHFDALAVAKTALALQGYGVGLLGLIGVKILAPGFYARQDMRTPVTIAIIVLVLTQAMNARLRALARPRRPGAVGQPGRASSTRSGCSSACAAAAGTGRRRAGAASSLSVVVATALDGRAARAWPRRASTGSAWPATRRLRVAWLAGLHRARPALVYFGVLLAAGIRPRDFSRRA